MMISSRTIALLTHLLFRSRNRSGGGIAVAAVAEGGGELGGAEVGAEHGNLAVAILVDRGLDAGATKYAGSRHVAHNVALLFFGGPDDREALAYTWRMAEHPGMARRSPEGEPVKESYICATLVAVLAAGFVTDAIGIHALFGAFVVGILVPKDGRFAGVLIEKVEDLVSGLFLPLYFVSSGLKTNVASISGARSWGLLVLVITNACLGKIAGTVAVALLACVPPREAITLGFLMNTKGLVELIVLNIGRDRKVLNDESFAILVLMALFTTFITTPAVMAVYKPACPAAPYNHSSLEGADAELRILACFHASRSIPTLINLVESSRGTRRRRLVVYALHLVELSERPFSILMVQRAPRNGMPFSNRRYEDASGGNNIIGGGGEEVVQVAFEAYRRLSSVAVRPMTAVSDLDTIHE